MANYTRYRSGVQRVDDVLGKVEKDIRALETSAATFATETAVDTLVSALFGSTIYTQATISGAPTDGSIRFVRVSDGGFLGSGGMAAFINNHWVDTATGAEYT